MKQKAAWSQASTGETTISRSCEGVCKSRRSLGGACRSDARSRLFAGKLLLPARRQWGRRQQMSADSVCREPAALQPSEGRKAAAGAAAAAL